MYGFKKKTQRFENGGMIRGKGTGTSDSIKAKMPEGTYIMPADTTKGMGLGKPVDVRLSNGEFALPPKAVHAIGAKVLDTIKDATHTPVEPKGFAPRRMYMADGGLLGRMFGGEPNKVTPEQQAAAQAALDARRAKQQEPQGGISGYAGMSLRERKMKEMGSKDGGMVKGYRDGGILDTSPNPSDVFKVGGFNLPGKADSQNPPVAEAGGATLPQSAKANTMLGAPMGFRTVAQGAQVLPGKPEAAGIMSDDNRVKSGRPSISETVNVLNKSGANTQKAIGEGDYGGAAASVVRGAALLPAGVVSDVYRGAVEPWVRNAGKLAQTANAVNSLPTKLASKPLAKLADATVNFGEQVITGEKPESKTRIQDSINPPKKSPQTTALSIIDAQNKEFEGVSNPSGEVKPAGFAPQSYASRMTAEQDASFANTPATKDVMSNGIVIEGRNAAGKPNSFSGNKITELSDRGNLSVMDSSGLRDTPYYKQAVAELSGQGLQQVAPQNQVITIGENGGFGFDKKDPAAARTEAIQRRADDLRRAAGIRSPTKGMIEAATAEYQAYDAVANNERTNQTADKRTAADMAMRGNELASTDRRFDATNRLAERQDAREGAQAGYTNQKLGFEVSGLQRLEALQSKLTDPDPKVRAMAADSLRAMQGKDEMKAVVASGRSGVDANGERFTDPDRVINLRTGEEIGVAQQQGQKQPKPLPERGKEVAGETYTTPAGTFKYDGKNFIPVGE